MSKILVVASSVLGDSSVSNRLVRDAVETIRAQEPGAEVVWRDLGANPVPHLTLDSAAALKGEPANDAQRAARAASDELVAELLAADAIVIGAPMYNFGIPSSLKAWFDQILRAGVTFRYTEQGPEGLLSGKRAIVVLTRGGLYSAGPARGMDSQEPHLRTLLGFVGIDDPVFVRAESLAMGAEASAKSVEAAQAALRDAVAARRPKAA